MTVASGGTPDLKNARVHGRRNSLEEQALAYLTKNGAASVAQLYHALRARNPSLTMDETTDLVWRLAEQGRAELKDAPPATKSLLEYLGLWERNLWFYGSLAASLLTVLMIYTLPSESPLVALRWILGSVFVLFVPGYVTVQALFPRVEDLDGIERLMLSIGLSLALVPLIGLLLSYTPWGIRLDPIVISLTVFTVGLALGALFWRFRILGEMYEAKRPV